jgi:SNF2 family DNA or RNA helicase
MKSKPKHPYQERVRDFVKNKNKVGFLVFYGGGKTYLSLQWIADRLEAGEDMFPAIVFCPSNLIPQWAEQIGQHTHFSYSRVEGSAKQRLNALQTKADIYLINYDALSGAISKTKKKPGMKVKRSFIPYPVYDCICRIQYQTVLVDESTALKNDTTARFMAIRKAMTDVPHRAILTGAMITEHPEEVFAQMLFLDQGTAFGAAFWRFRQTFFSPGPPWKPYEWTLKPGARDIITQQLNAKCIRVRKEEILSELPPQEFLTVNLEMPEPLRKQYEELRKEFKLTLPSGTAFETQWAMVKSRKLHEMCQGFVYMPDPKDPQNTITELLDTTKLDWFEETISSLLLNGPLLVWSNYTVICSMLSITLDKLKIPHANYWGKNDKELEKEAFINGQRDVMILSEAAGYRGLNLQRANQAVLFCIDYKVEWFTNLLDRCHRLGSEIHDKVTYHIVMMDKTIDGVVYQAVCDKRDMATEILNYIREA